MVDSASLIPDAQLQPVAQKPNERVFFGLIQKVGSMGRYQYIQTILWCFMGYLCGGLMLITPFLFFQDPYECAPEIAQCKTYVCSLPPADRLPYIPPKSMHSLANKFGDYRCDSQKLQLDFIQTMMYIGGVVGFLLSALIGDLIGRKLLIVLCMLTNALGLIITIFCSNLTMAGVGLFISTIGIQDGFNVCFYFLAQTVSETHREKYSVAIQMFYGFGVLLNVPWYYLVGDWQLIMVVFYLIPSLAVILGIIIFVRDTPICLVLRNQPQKAYNDLMYTAKMNRVVQSELTLSEIKDIKRHYSSHHDQGQKTNHKSFTVLDLFKYPSLRWITIMLIILQCTIIFQFYAPALMLDKFKMNLFINGLVVGLSEVISYPICYVLIMRTKRQYIAYFCFAATALCSVILTFVWDQDSEETPSISSSIGVLVLIFIFRFTIASEYTFFYVYFNQIYPTQIRVLGTSLVSLMGAAMVTVAPEIIDGCIQGGFPIMVMFAILSLVSMACSYKLPQTLHKTPPDIIEELKQQATEESVISEEITGSITSKEVMVNEQSEEKND